MLNTNDVEGLPTWRQIAEDGLSDEYEPQLICLIPIYLRSRLEFYREAAKKVEGSIEEMWRTTGQFYESREDFEKSEPVSWMWNRSCPPWWGFDDIVAWVDVRICVRLREFQVGLFLPNKRVNRQLRDKRYYFERKETYSIGDRGQNSDLQDQVVRLVFDVVNDEKARGRYVQLEMWERVIRSVDFVSLIWDAAESDLQGQ